MNRILVLFLLACVVAWGVACGGGQTAGGSQTADSQTTEPTTAAPVEMAPDDAAAGDAGQMTEAQPISDATAAEGCEEYFRFCVAAAVSGTVESVAAGGVGANIDTCAAWAAPGEARILEMPMMLNAGEDGITVALTRIAAYTGPGRYELVSVSSQGIPDMFPTMEVAGRTFGDGAGATAVVTVNADGSGTLEATGLAEIASLQVSDPDPDARVDLAMQWSCQDS
jgi:hypothetical protein